MTAARVASIFLRDNPLRQKFKTALAQYQATSAPATPTVSFGS